MNDKAEIRELIDNWVLWRDSGEFDRFATLWHPEGRMVTTWVEATAKEFVERARGGFAASIKSQHTLGGTTVDVAGTRAIAQSRMQIMNRAPIHGVMADVTCTGRFWDALEKCDGVWLLRLRQPIYESDRINPVDPNATLELDQDLLAAYPEGYRHLAYLQTCMGFKVVKTLPGTRGPEVEAVYARGRRWLAGEPATCLDATA
jgi:hypothetical protein